MSDNKQKWIERMGNVNGKTKRKEEILEEMGRRIKQTNWVWMGPDSLEDSRKGQKRKITEQEEKNFESVKRLQEKDCPLRGWEHNFN